jgi:RimJ/RimL family protein N-acetyltransferase
MSQYPKEYEKTITLRDGTEVLLRPELSTDTQMLWEMLSTLSSESKRFLGGGITRKKVQAWTSKINYAKVLPIVGVVKEKGKPRIIASASLRFFTDFPAFQHRAEFGITVHDDYQGKGLGTALTKHMLEIARKKGLKKVSVHVSTENKSAIHIYEKCGFKVEATLRKEHFAYGKYYDNYAMSIFF